MPTEKRTNRKKVVAVGGAKGGIGKSIFATNLALLLSSVGRTVIVDLDLGGANLHLYLGETRLRWSINDFLNRKVATLQEALVQSKYGLQLIGGNSSQLGSANINFSLKLKLLKAIQQIDADYIILDLGGNTSYDMLDFFLASDCGIVLTTCDPASYLDAYNFIKVSLFRKLNLLLGSNSTDKISKNSDLKTLVHEATLSRNGSQVKTISELLERIRKTHPHDLPIISRAVSTFTPHLVINRVRDEHGAEPIIKRIQEVSKRALSIEVKHAGNLGYLKEIEESARDLVPVMVKHPQGKLSQELRHIARNILQKQ
ncbi:MAG: P-loop NTPase [Syntrophales bacterium]|nr:P-loop NTPase [Syntrophales bacterium]